MYKITEFDGHRVPWVILMGTGYAEQILKKGARLWIKWETGNNNIHINCLTTASKHTYLRAVLVDMTVFFLWEHPYQLGVEDRFKARRFLSRRTPIQELHLTTPNHRSKLTDMDLSVPNIWGILTNDCLSGCPTALPRFASPVLS